MRHYINNRGMIGWKILDYLVAKAVEIKGVYLIANYKGVRSNYYGASAGSTQQGSSVGTSVDQSPCKRCLRLSCQGHMQKCYDCAWLSLTALSTVTCNLLL
jgi:hypothetical protein